MLRSPTRTVAFSVLYSFLSGPYISIKRPLIACMWYSSSEYQARPSSQVPVPQFSFEKSSVKDDGVELVFVFSLVLSEFVFLLRLADFQLALFELLELFATRLPLLSLVTRATMTINTITPIPIKTSTAPM